MDICACRHQQQGQRDSFSTWLHCWQHGKSKAVITHSTCGTTCSSEELQQHPTHHTLPSGCKRSSTLWFSIAYICCTHQGAHRHNSTLDTRHTHTQHHNHTRRHTATHAAAVAPTSPANAVHVMAAASLPQPARPTACTRPPAASPSSHQRRRHRHTCCHAEVPLI